MPLRMRTLICWTCLRLPRRSLPRPWCVVGSSQLPASSRSPSAWMTMCWSGSVRKVRDIKPVSTPCCARTWKHTRHKWHPFLGDRSLSPRPSVGVRQGGCGGAGFVSFATFRSFRGPNHPLPQARHASLCGGTATGADGDRARL
jgi:hypothetical protein